MLRGLHKINYSDRICHDDYLAGVLGCVIVLVIVFVIVMRCRLRRRRRRRRQATPCDDYSYSDMKSHKKKMTAAGKISEEESTASFMHRNIPLDTPLLPPPVLPPRPASYTPSNAGDSMNTLNNFDTLPDEVAHMSTITQPIEIPAFMQNVDVEKPPEGRDMCPAPPPRYHDVVRPADRPFDSKSCIDLCTLVFLRNFIVFCYQSHLYLCRLNSSLIPLLTV